MSSRGGYNLVVYGDSGHPALVLVFLGASPSDAVPGDAPGVARELVPSNHNVFTRLEQLWPRQGREER